MSAAQRPSKDTPRANMRGLYHRPATTDFNLMRKYSLSASLLSRHFYSKQHRNSAGIYRRMPSSTLPKKQDGVGRSLYGASGDEWLDDQT